MIALDTRAKIGMSPKKPQVELREDSDDKESDGDESDSQRTEGNPGWADAMQKILKTKKPKRKKTIVLSKAKRLCDTVKEEKEESVTFEIDKVKEEIKTEEVEESKDNVQQKLIEKQLKERRKNNLGIRIKPSITDRERERTLQKIATKGVVQLFNAVRQQQGEITKKLSEAGPLERKREKVLKNIDKTAFLDILMGGSKSIKVDNAVKNETQDNAKVKKKKDKETWNVLRDDFVMGTKLKDWDRQSKDDDSSAPEEMDSDN